MFDSLHRALNGATRLTAIIAGYALLGLSFAICAEILLRRLFAYSMQGVDEIGGYVLAATCAFGFAYTLLQRGHTRLDMLVHRSPPWLAVALNLLAAASMSAVATFMLWRGYVTFSRSWGLGSLAPTPLQTPTWIPQLIWVLGFALFAAVAWFMLIRALAALRDGPQAVNEVVGPVSLGEEIEAEVSERVVR